MNQPTDYTPTALYARVSSDRQDVDLSVAAHFRGLEFENIGADASETSLMFQSQVWERLWE